MTKLSDILAEDSDRTFDFRRLMLTCKTDGQAKKLHIVCVGAGDAFINRYWPQLRKEAFRGRIHLTVADNKPLSVLVKEKIDIADKFEKKTAKTLKDLYDQLIKAIIRNKSVKYLNIKNDRDRSWYNHLLADIVFILLPDDIHIVESRPWIKKSTVIFIEKPYNRDLMTAEEFEKELQTMIKSRNGNLPIAYVWPFDHYLAKIHTYESKKKQDRIKERIGVLEKIDFGILEAGGVEEWRSPSLEAGIIYDLFSHILAMISVELDLGTFKQEKIVSVKVARQEKISLPEKCETFAELDFYLDDYKNRRVHVRGCVGKGIGNIDEKFLTFIGRSGKLYFHLDPNGKKEIEIEENGEENRDEKSLIKDPIYDIKNGHEDFLKILLKGDYRKSPIGGLSGDRAIQILRILTQIRERIPRKISSYSLGSEKEKILEIATNLKF